MRQLPAAILLLLAVLLTSWVFQDSANSGKEILSLPVDGEMTSVVKLESHQSPVRVYLTVRSDIALQEESNTAYHYELQIRSPAGRDIITERNSHVEKRSDTGAGFVATRETHNMGTFDVVTPGAYTLVAQIMPEQAKVTDSVVTVHANVSGLNWPMLALAAVLLLLGLGWIIKTRRGR